MLSKSQGITGFSSFKSVVREHDSEGRDVERFCRNYYGNGKPNPDVKGSKWEAKGQRRSITDLVVSNLDYHSITLIYLLQLLLPKFIMKKDLVYKVVRVLENYRLVEREIWVRVKEIEEKVER
uniref:Uncharacterized protein n=1 Tax=Cucumis melo TaxID=3656 RepID=A0A9I9EKI3_CUCME